MRKNAQKPWFHAGEGQQQDTNIKPDKREDKEALQSASHLEDTCLRDRHRTGDSI